jgi:ABC-2 type transport system permease protein
MRAIYSLWLRELKRYWRSKQRIAMSLAQPVLYLLVFGFGLQPVYQKAGAGNFIQFLAPGVIAMTVLFSSMGSGIALMIDRQFGFLKETLVAPVPRIQVMLGRTFGAATIAVLQGLLVAAVCLATGFRPLGLASAAAGLAFVLLIAIAFAGLGTALGASIREMQSYAATMNFLVLPLTLLSGMLFPLENLPVLLATLTDIDPLSYGVDGLRATLIGQAHFNVLLDAAVLMATAVVLLSFGAWRFAKLEP